MQLRLAIAAWLVGIGICAPLRAAPPWNKLELFHRLEADPEKAYPLSEHDGPWVIMAVTFSGQEAQTQARELVYELRSRYHLPAFTHAVHFDHALSSTQPATGQRVRQPKYRYRVNEMNEIAVLVGNFSAVDDPAAKKTLDKIKHAQPDCLNVELRMKEGKSDNRSLGRLRLIQQAVLPEGNKNKKKGPMGHAFITTNPLLPNEYFVPNGVDKLVLEMNEPVEFSLLKCPGKYTVKVATFTGRVVIDPKQIADIEKGKKFESQLADAAEKAHKLTLALRQLGYEAYEYHERYASIVTIGSFQQVGTPRADGKLEINPQVHALMQTFGADRKMGEGSETAQVGKPKVHSGIPLDLQPLPIEVPRRSLGAQYDRQPLAGRF